MLVRRVAKIYAVNDILFKGMCVGTFCGVKDRSDCNREKNTRRSTVFEGRNFQRERIAYLENFKRKFVVKINFF